jgi:ribonucleases P/MRP protein subunit RPP40
LKPSNQCKKAAARARVVLGQLLKFFHFRDRNHFLNLYKTYVQPHLEFAVTAWAPWTATDIDLLESVQEKAIRNNSGLKGHTYEEKCLEVGLETLASRRKKLDLMQTFKILKGIDGVDSTKLFEKVDHTAGTRLGMDPWNLKKKKARKEVRAHSFALRVVDSWNNLPADMKKLDKADSFKRCLKKTNL